MDVEVWRNNLRFYFRQCCYSFWGTTTRKGNTLYIHILSQKMPEFVTLPLNEKVVSATLFDTGEKVKYEKIQEV